MTLKAASEITVNNHIVLKRLSHDADRAKYDAIVNNRNHLLPWLPWAAFYKEFKEMPEYTESQIKEFDKGASFAYDIFYDENFVGSIDIHHISEENHNCELGYWLSKDYTGRGIITQAAAKITEYAFNELDMHRVAILAATKNEASCKVAERLDFRHEGTLREELLLDENYHDVEVYATIKQA